MMFVAIFFLGLYEVIFVIPLILHVHSAALVAYSILNFIKNKENIEASDMAIATYSEGLEKAKARLEDLKKNSVKLTPEELEKENICKPLKIETEDRLTKLKNNLKLRKEVLTKFKMYKKFYDAGKLKEAFSDYQDEELQIITEEIENQIRKRNLNK